ncbi:hypothetical protein ACOSQ3_007518 [Xanthoceras sorbifolium]
MESFVDNFFTQNICSHRNGNSLHMIPDRSLLSCVPWRMRSPSPVGVAIWIIINATITAVGAYVDWFLFSSV